jgi:hypothetical protein
MDTQVAVMPGDVQVVAKPRRQTYTAECKRRMLKEADACTTPGAVGALLRREGLSSSHLASALRLRPYFTARRWCSAPASIRDRARFAFRDRRRRRVRDHPQ